MESVGTRTRQRGFQVVLFLAAAVLLVVLIRGWQLGERESSEQTVTPLLHKGEGAAVVGIHLQLEAGALRLEREGEQWWILEPLEDLGSTRMVRELFRAIEGMEIVRLLETDVLEPYELDPPRAVLTLSKLDGEQIQVLIGTTAPASGNIYASWEGLGGVAIIPRFLVTRFFMGELLFWREREMLPPARAAVDSVWVLRGAERFRARRISREEWTLVEPGDREADPISCERTVAAFWRFPYTEFFDKPEQWPFLGLDPPLASWIVFRGARTDTLHIGRRLDEGTMAVQLVGRPPGRVRGDLFDFLTGGVAAIEVRRLLQGEPEAAKHVLLAGADGGRLYSRTGETWQMADVDPSMQSVLERGEMPQSATLEWQAATDPAIGGDLANVFELQCGRWLAPLGEPARSEAYALRMHFWEDDGTHQWAFFARHPQDEVGGATVNRRAGGASFVGTAVGSRFPLKPMHVDSDIIGRWWLRLTRKPIPLHGD